MDHFSVLRVSRDASEDDVRSSFRRLALMYHPALSRDKVRSTVCVIVCVIVCVCDCVVSVTYCSI